MYDLADETSGFPLPYPETRWEEIIVSFASGYHSSVEPGRSAKYNHGNDNNCSREHTVAPSRGVQSNHSEFGTVSEDAGRFV